MLPDLLTVLAQLLCEEVDLPLFRFTREKSAVYQKSNLHYTPVLRQSV